MSEDTVTHGALSPAQREALASRRIFFGHQSVGANLVAGIDEIVAEDSALRLRVVRTREPWTVDGPAFMESPVGVNGDPGSKSRAFATALSRGLDQPGSIALHKYCYVDVGEGTDPARLFREYRRTMRKLRAQHPMVRFVHVTMPLTANVESPVKLLAKRLLGRGTEIELNLKRNRFNSLMREEYAGREPVFDLAALESTHPDGRRAFVRWGGEQVFVLAKEYTFDGGHLTPAARRRIGMQLLEMLADLPVPSDTAAVVR